MTDTAVYDFRATDLVNMVASNAMSLINACLREDPAYCIDMRRVCLWSVDAVVPLASRAEKAGLAHEAAIVIQQALWLDRAVVSCAGCGA